MLLSTYISLLLVGVPFALSNPVPDGTPSLPPVTRKTTTTTYCPPSTTVTVKPTCPTTTCSDPMMCPAVIYISSYPCACSKKAPTTATVTARCPGDCKCTIPTQWVPSGCPSTTTTTTKKTVASITRYTLATIQPAYY